jgi:hypothetical protein
MDCIKRHLELLEFNSTPRISVGDKVFYRYGRIVLPLGPAKFDYTISASDARAALKSVGGLLVQWNSGFQQEPSEWYAVICDRFRALAEIPSKHRSEINRGLRNCEVRRIDCEYFARHAYEVYMKAATRYRGPVAPLRSEESFKKGAIDSGKFEDILHHWGVFCAGKLVAYAANSVYPKIQAGYTVVKMDPEYGKAYPVYALIHEMTRHYLEEQHYEYVFDGFRSTLHDTHFQDFLMKKFGFRKAYSRLHLVYRRGLSAFVKATYPCRAVLGALDPRVRQLYLLEGIRRGVAPGV